MCALEFRLESPDCRWRIGSDWLRRSMLAGLLLLGLAGCAVTPPADQTTGPTALERVDLARARGDDAAAADAMREAAGESTGSERVRRLLIAAWLAARAGDPATAGELALQARSGRSSGDLPGPLDAAVEAELSLLAGDPDAAIEQTAAELPAGAPDLEWLLNTRAEALTATRRIFEASETRARLLAIALSPGVRAAERDRLWAVLEGSRSSELRSWRPAAGSPLSAWLDFALQLRVARFSPGALDRLITVVSTTGALPGGDAGWLAGVRERAVEGPVEIGQIAVLLPLSGQLATVGAAVRTGILAAHYQSAPPRPMLRFHDVGDQGDAIGPALQRAAAEGADLVIGPLRRDQVAELADGAAPALPVLALNAIPAPDRNGLASGFGVLPEHSARSAARHARAGSQRLVAALTPADGRGERVLQAFEAELARVDAQLPGQPGLVIVEKRYQPEEADHSVAIRQLLALSDSDTRYRRLREVLDLAPEHRVRRRQDIQAIFMEAYTGQGRLLQPQLKFHQGGDLPILATESILEGAPEGSDPDLSGITVFAAPAIIQPERVEPPLTDVERLLGNPLDRNLQALYYFGLDAYRLAPMLPQLRQSDHGMRIQGATGSLSVGVDGLVERDLPPARFGTGGLQLLSAE